MRVKVRKVQTCIQPSDSFPASWLSRLPLCIMPVMRVCVCCLRRASQSVAETQLIHHTCCRDPDCEAGEEII